MTPSMTLAEALAVQIFVRNLAQGNARIYDEEMAANKVAAEIINTTACEVFKRFEQEKEEK